MHETIRYNQVNLFMAEVISQLVVLVYNFGIPKPDVTGMSKTSFQTLTRIYLLLLKDFLDCKVKSE